MRCGAVGLDDRDVVRELTQVVADLVVHAAERGELSAHPRNVFLDGTVESGVVVDGAVRDSLEIEEMGFPVFSVGTNPNGPTKLVPGRIGHPISIGGVTVHAGDLVLGDADGVVIVEREKIEALLSLAEKKVKDEAARIAAIQQGDTAAKWLDAALRSAGVLKEGERL